MDIRLLVVADTGKVRNIWVLNMNDFGVNGFICVCEKDLMRSGFGISVSPFTLRHIKNAYVFKGLGKIILPFPQLTSDKFHK